ncbi:cation diffusion facilitator family transporter [Segnochrobactraceae bacterium EtOH-i3]
MSFTKRIALGSVAVGVIVFAIKYLAYYVTGSIALYSDALESIINITTSLAALIAISVSAQPPDSNHPFGHEKAEYFSAVLEGVLIVVAAGAILNEAWKGFLDPRPIDAPALGLAINAGASVLNGIWGYVLVKVGRSHRSPALVADGKHVLTDVWTSVGVVVGVAAAALSGWMQLDAIVAAAVALNILWTGWGLMRESVGGLMDEGLPDHELEAIRQVISAHADGAIEAHDLKTRRAGRTTFVEFHLVVAGEMTVEDSHAICDRLEEAIEKLIPDARISIHVEPREKAKLSGVPVV